MGVRTTLTLDSDVFELLERASIESGKSFASVVNETLRLGLFKPEPLRIEATPVIRARAMGSPKVPLTKIEMVLEHLEGPYHR